MKKMKPKIHVWEWEYVDPWGTDPEASILPYIPARILNFMAGLFRTGFFKRVVAGLTAGLFFWTMTVSPVFAERIELQGGSVDVTVDGNKTNWDVTGNPIWEMPEFNLAESSIYNITGLTQNASIAVLVNGGSVSSILGEMNLFNIAFILQNLAGIDIGASARINLNNSALIASTLPLDLTATDFLAGDYQFGGEASRQGLLRNAGTITGGKGDLVALVGTAIENSGTIEVPMGTVALAAGKTVAVGISPDGMVTIGVDEATANELGLADQIKNSGTISAKGGRVVLNAKAVDGLFDKAINLISEPTAVSAVMADDGVIEFVAKGDIVNQGVIQAEHGTVKIEATGDVKTRGTLRAETLYESAASFKIGGVFDVRYSYHDNLDNAITYSENTILGNAGYLTEITDDENIEISANVVITLVGDVTFRAGWNNPDAELDGVGAFLMDATASILGGGHNLGIYAVQDSSVGILVNVGTLTLGRQFGADPVVFSSSTTVDDIDVDTFKTEDGASFSKTVAVDPVEESSNNVITTTYSYLVYDVTQLQAMQNNLGRWYKMANNIDASATATWNGGAGFDSVGDSGGLMFTGKFNGDSNVITGLTINRPLNGNQGLFGYTSGATIQNVGLENVHITAGSTWVGALVGQAENTHITNSYATGSIDGNFGDCVNSIGGLVGESFGSTIENSYADVSVSGAEAYYVGGLVGNNSSDSYNSIISYIINSFATGDVSGRSDVGGLVGGGDPSNITNSYFSGGPDNGAGTYEAGGRSAFYKPTHAVYAIGTAGQWDIFGSSGTAQVWDTYTNALPTLHGRSAQAGTPNFVWSGNISTAWGTGTNWSTGTTPGSSSSVYVFDRANDPTINVAASIANFYLTSGAVTQNVDLAISGDYIQLGGTFTGNNPTTNSFSVSGSFTIPDAAGAFNRYGAQVSGAYMVRDVYDLQAMKGYLSSNFTLADNIDASVTDHWNYDSASGHYLGFDPIGNSWLSYYAGTFDGNSKTITGLTINRPGENYVGLFGYTDGAQIKNMGLVSANVRGAESSGGIVGEARYNTSIENVYVTGEVHGTVNVGGFVGWHGESTISNSYADVDVTGTSNIGGLAGSNNSASSITNSYSLGDVTGDNSVGGLVGQNYGSSITNSYATGAVDGNSNVGGFVGYNVDGMITNSYAAGPVSGSSDSTGGFIGGYASGTLTNNWWSNAYDNGLGGSDNGVPFFPSEVAGQYQKSSAASDFYNPGHEVYDPYNDGGNRWGFDEGGNGSATWVPVVNNDSKTASYPILGWQSEAVHMAGSGTNPDPYVVTNIAQLQLAIYDLDANYKISKNINADIAGYNTGAGFRPIGDADHAFTGTLQGLGHIISQLKINRTSTDYVGLFGYIGAAGLVNMLALEQVSSYGQHYVGGLAGYNAGTLTNVYTTGSFTVSGINVIGGLVGANAGSIANAYSSARVSATGEGVGGLAGTNSGTIAKTYSMGQVTGGDAATTGGLVGSGAGTVTSSYWNEAMSGQSRSAGGSAGKVIGGTVDEEGYWVPNPEDVENPDADMMSSNTYSGWDFGDTWVMDEGGSFPHFKFRYSEGVRGVWGTVYNTEGAVAEAGKQVDLYVNTNPLDTTGLGTQVDYTKSTANGMYYFVMGANDVQATDWVIGKLNGGDGFTGNTRMPAETGSLKQLDIWGTHARIQPHPENRPIEVPVVDSERATRELDTMMSQGFVDGVEGQQAPEVVIVEEGSGVSGLGQYIPMNVSEYEDDYLLEEAGVSMQEKQSPGQEPVPMSAVVQSASMAETVSPEAVSSMVKGIVSELHSGKKAVSGSGSGSSASSKENSQSTAESVASTVASLTGSPSESAASQAPSQGNAGQSGNASESSQSQGAPSKGQPSAGDASSKANGKGESQESESTTRQSRAPKSGDAAKNRDTFFDTVPAAKALTNVRVVEGSVYVIDDTNDLSLLARGESVRVSSRKPVESQKLPKEVLESNAKFAAAMKARVPQAVAKDNEPVPLTVTKADQPTPLTVTKADEPTPLTVVKADPVKALAEAKEAKELPLFAKDFASLVEPAGEVVNTPKADIVDAAVSAVTQSVAERKVQPGDLRFATLKNPGLGVFIKRPGGEWEPAQKGQVVLPGDLVKTAETGSVDVLLDNGKTGRVEVKPGSLFRISKADADPVTGDKNTMLDLAVGKVLVHASKLKGNSRFEVKTPTALTGVRGTVFEVVVKERKE